MQINFNQLWKKDLGLIYKEISIDKGKQFKTDIDLKEVKNIIANYKVNDKSFTDSVEIIDIENNIINIPFNEFMTKISAYNFVKDPKNIHLFVKNLEKALLFF